jgi:hypothetical protein
MPEVDFMILCDYVRADNGILHIIAGGIDHVTAATVPSAQNVGIALRLTLTRAECDRTHDLELIFQNQDGHRFVQIRATFASAYSEDLPPGWPAYGIVPLNIALPLPSYGIYSLELLIDGQSKKSIGVLVVPPAAPALGGPGVNPAD